MADPRVQIQELARVGASARMKELAVEIERIRRAFPDIERLGEVPLPRVRALKANGPVAKKALSRPGWSAAARKAVSLRMKKYWAAKRKSAQ